MDGAHQRKCAGQCFRTSDSGLLGLCGFGYRVLVFQAGRGRGQEGAPVREQSSTCKGSKGRAGLFQEAGGAGGGTSSTCV